MKGGGGSLFQAPREKREGESEGTKTTGVGERKRASPPRFRPLALSFALLSRSLEQATAGAFMHILVQEFVSLRKYIVSYLVFFASFCFLEE